MHVGTVQGGTNAGWRRLREPRREPWFCGCYEVHEHGLGAGAMKKQQRPGTVNCTDCGEKRPN